MRAFVCLCIGMFARPCARNLIPSMVLKPDGRATGARSGHGQEDGLGVERLEVEIIPIHNRSAASSHLCTELWFTQTGGIQIFSIPVGCNVIKHANHC